MRLAICFAEEFDCILNCRLRGNCATYYPGRLAYSAADPHCQLEKLVDAT